MEITSDELLCPTRGTDWGDNGVWRTLHAHTWDATHSQLLDTWNALNSNVYKLNQILHTASAANAQQTAEAKFLRAFNMFYIVDFWRKVPFRTPDDAADKDPEVKNATDAVAFIIADLEAAIPNLPAVDAMPNSQTVKASKAAAYFLLAKVYLNKHVYLGTTADAADMTKVVQNVDMLTAQGFALQAGFFNIFRPTDDSETILWTPACVCNRMWSALHYNQPSDENSGGGWNGFSTTADFYALFEGSSTSNAPGSGQEERRGFVPQVAGYYTGYGFLVGQQYGYTGAALKDRPGNPLDFTKEFATGGQLGNGEREGMRLLKYTPNNGGTWRSHLILMRYADAHLMKVEAILRGGTSSDNAETLFDALRTLRGASNKTATLDEILNERGRELYLESWRRHDQVRFGTFKLPFTLKTGTDPNRDVFPIPSVAVSSNPNLVQNPGY